MSTETAPSIAARHVAVLGSLSPEVVPIHWPVRSVPEPLEREMFVEWHRGLLEGRGGGGAAGERGLPAVGVILLGRGDVFVQIPEHEVPVDHFLASTSHELGQ